MACCVCMSSMYKFGRKFGRVLAVLVVVAAVLALVCIPAQLSDAGCALFQQQLPAAGMFVWSWMAAAGAAVPPQAVVGACAVILMVGLVAICSRHPADDDQSAVPMVARQARVGVLLWMLTSATVAAAATCLALPSQAAMACPPVCALVAAALVQLAVGALMFSPVQSRVAPVLELALQVLWVEIKLACV